MSGNKVKGKTANSSNSDDKEVITKEDSVPVPHGTLDKDSDSDSDRDRDSSNAELLAKIAKLEAANKELLKERDTFKNSIVINTNDVYANLKQLQVNFSEKAANGYEAMRNSVPASGNYGFDLTP